MLPGSLQAGDVVHFQGNSKHPLSGRGLGPKTGWDRTISLCKLTLRVSPKHPGNGSLPIASHPAPSSLSISNDLVAAFPHICDLASPVPGTQVLLPPSLHTIKDLGLSISCFYMNLLAAQCSKSTLFYCLSLELGCKRMRVLMFKPSRVYFPCSGDSRSYYPVEWEA